MSACCNEYPNCNCSGIPSVDRKKKRVVLLAGNCFEAAIIETMLASKKHPEIAIEVIEPKKQTINEIVKERHSYVIEARKEVEPSDIKDGKQSRRERRANERKNKKFK